MERCLRVGEEGGEQGGEGEGGGHHYSFKNINASGASHERAMTALIISRVSRIDAAIAGNTRVKRALSSILLINAK